MIRSPAHTEQLHSRTERCMKLSAAKKSNQDNAYCEHEYDSEVENCVAMVSCIGMYIVPVSADWCRDVPIGAHHGGSVPGHLQ
jgi:hypothetical protein